MRVFLLKTIMLTLVLFGISFGVDYLIEKGIKTSSYREISKWTEVIKGGIDSEILVVGSSRALVHFDPRLIEENTGMSCYNLGLDGSKYESQSKVLVLYLSHNKKPKTLIWSIDLSSFNATEGIYRFEQFLPFWDEPDVKSILKLNKDQNQDYFNIPIAKYSNNPALKYRGLLKEFGINVAEPKLYKGYRESNQEWDGKFDEFKFKSSGIYKESLDMRIFNDFLNSIIDIQKSEIEVRWIITPYYSEAIDMISNQSQIRDLFKNSADSLNISLIDMAKSTMSRKKEFFYNGSHMNTKGVNEFNKLIINEIN